MKKLDKAGRIIIPVYIRKILKIKENDEFKIELKNGKIILTPINQNITCENCKHVKNEICIKFRKNKYIYTFYCAHFSKK